MAASRKIHGAEVCPRELRANLFQMLFFKAATGYALTTVFAGFAFTICILPKISRFPALVAGFKRVLTMQTPGMVNLPLFFTSVAAIVAKVSSNLEPCDFFNSCFVANAPM